MRRWLAFGLLSVAAVFAYYAQAQVPSLTKKVEVDRGYFYRLIVNLAYKGEPLTFNIVVGCNVRTTIYRDNDRTVEMGVVPMAYGLKMRDGRGIVVRPPEACQGETTENGRVPATLLPLIVTYENADAPWFGLAYASDDAYESSRSELKFFKATISRAARAEWEEWRRTEAPKNFVTYELLGVTPENRFKHTRWVQGRHFMGYDCQAFARVPLPERARAVVREHWPASRPAYWYPDSATEGALLDKNRAGGAVLPYARTPYERWSGGEPGFGMARRAPGALIFFSARVAGDVYPARSDLTLSKLDQDGNFPPNILAKPRLVWADAEIKSDLLGFGYCDRVHDIANLPFYNRGPATQYENRINRQAIDSKLFRPINEPSVVLQGDEYMFFYRPYTINTLFGGL
jgi:hypothetical protein